MSFLRSSGVIGPMCEAGGKIHTRCVMPGVPFASSSETSASPTPSSRIAFSASSFGFARIVSADRLHRLLVARREGAQRVLHAVAELAQHLVGDVERILRDEIDADALASDQPHDLLDLLEQRRRRLAEQQMRLVEEEHELRLVAVADLGKILEELGEQPQQERRVQPRVLHQLVGRENVDDAPALRIGLHEVVDVEHRLAEEPLAALLLDLQQAALDRADRGRRDVAVLRS